MDKSVLVFGFWSRDLLVLMMRAACNANILRGFYTDMRGVGQKDGEAQCYLSCSATFGSSWKGVFKLQSISKTT